MRKSKYWPCEHIVLKNEIWWLIVLNGRVRVSIVWKFCPICGAKRPETMWSSTYGKVIKINENDEKK